METVIAAEAMDTVEMSTLAMIPSESQVSQAISMLCKKQEINHDKFIYLLG